MYTFCPTLLFTGQKADWKTHKTVCKEIKKGASLIRTKMPKFNKKNTTNNPNNTDNSSSSSGDVKSSSGARGARGPKDRVRSSKFQEDFGVLDSKAMGEDYNVDTCVIWEYDAGGRNVEDWQRYPPRIEESLEMMNLIGAPKYVQRSLSLSLSL